MALGTLDRIRSLALAKNRMTSERDTCQRVQTGLLVDFPGAATTINNSFNPLIAAFNNTITALQNALVATVLSNADKIAYADQAEADARAGNV